MFVDEPDRVRSPGEEGEYRSAVPWLDETLSLGTVRSGAARKYVAGDGLAVHKKAGDRTGRRPSLVPRDAGDDGEIVRKEDRAPRPGNVKRDFHI